MERARSGDLYVEFLRVPDLSAGLYVLAAGADDPQSPHQEDEVYAVLSGRGAIRVGDGDRPVGPGSIVYVPAHAEHHFHSIEEELELLVFFAPAETL
ncbi:MAG: dimethylsulfonioproprionate lyase family protein [Actinobacteria bacterium]|nr:dimethylsulfonioproprionate lyase family protein [Actinomycetota bacterium]